LTLTLGDFWSGALGAVGGAHCFLLFLEPEVDEEVEEVGLLPVDFARICER